MADCLDIKPGGILFRIGVIAGEIQKTMRQDGSLKELVENIAFGGTAGVIGQLSIYPLYTGKTDLHNNPDLRSGMTDRLRSIYRAGGLRGLYSGLIPTLSLTFPEKAIKLAMNDYFKAKLSDKEGNISIPRTMAAGAGAGLCQCVMTNPMELMRITMQTRQRAGLSKLDMPTLTKKLGTRRLYRDVPVTLLRDIPFSAIFFTLHSTLMDKFADAEGNTSPGMVLVSGFISSTAASGIVTPVDLVKTRLMTDTGMRLLSKQEMRGVHELERAQKKELYDFQRAQSRVGTLTRITQSFRHVYANHGIRGSYRGVSARIIINAPLFGIATMFYELQKKMKENGYI